ncbi:MAG: HDOD domain-containing protein [Spirochaetaceae bacterium]|jgi:hypothetical protein|nr:HDOD domain-containing protein [Spirochaetaceae bacterium]
MTRNVKSTVSRLAENAGNGFFFRHYPATVPAALRFYDIYKTNTLKPYDLFTIINADPVLTGITYALYHEFFPEVRQDFFGIPYIIIKLNINTVKNNVLKAAERAMPPQKTGKKIIKTQTDFLRRSLAAGIVSLLLAKRRGVSEADAQKYYCAGLLHDIGNFVLSKGSGAVFDGAVGLIDSPTAGRLTANLWGFPSVLHDAIAFHGDYQHYTKEHSDVVCHTALAVSVSDRWAAKSGAKFLSQPSASDKLFKLLNLDKGIFEGIEESFEAEFKKTAAFIGLGDD